MNKALEDRFLLTLIVAFCLLSFQLSSVEVSAELDDDVVVITVDSTNLKFSPNEVTINEGQTVRFFWSGEFLDHNAVAINGIFNSGEPEKEVDYFLCDTFSGVKNSSGKDSFFKNNEYDDATVEDVKKIEKISGQQFNIVEGIFPNSFSNVNIKKPISFAHIDVDTYISAKESFEFISSNSNSGALIILDDYGGWFTDGVTSFGNEIMKNKEFFAVPNHLGQLLIFKK